MASKYRLNVFLTAYFHEIEKMIRLVIRKSKKQRCLKDIQILYMKQDAKKNVWIKAVILTK